jgi:hypothetical protein
MINRYSLVHFFTVVTVSLLIGGCVSTHSTVNSVASRPIIQASLLIDPVEGKDACKVIAQDLSEGNSQSLYERVDINSIVKRILATFDKDKLTSKEYSLLKKQLHDLVRKKISLKKDKLRWDMVRGRADGERYFCLVRTSLFGNGVSYVEFELRYVDSKLQIIDWYDLVRETRVTDMFKDLFHDIYEMKEAHIMAMPYQWRSIVREQKKYFAFISAIGRENPKEILNAYDKLPLRFQNKPLYSLILLNLDIKMNDAQYYSVLRDFSRRFGGADRYAFLLIDLYLLDHEYDKVTQAIYSFKRQVGDDPLLALLLAEVENQRGNKKAFYGYCLKLLNDNPNYLDTYWYLLDQLVIDRHFDDAVVVLNVLSKMFEYTIYKDAFESDIKYRDFIKSSPFKSWIAESH